MIQSMLFHSFIEKVANVSEAFVFSTSKFVSLVCAATRRHKIPFLFLT